MMDILRSKGIICFFIFIIVMGVISSNSLNYVEGNNNIDNIVIMAETVK